MAVEGALRCGEWQKVWGNKKPRWRMIFDAATNLGTPLAHGVAS